MEAPVINVGIMTHKAISFVFNEEYVHTETGTFTIGEQRALWVNGKIVYNGKLFIRSYSSSRPARNPLST